MSNTKKLEQRKEFKEYLSIADKRVLDIKKSGMADKYKNKVPKKVYDALLRFEVKPYVEDWDG